MPRRVDGRARKIVKASSAVSSASVDRLWVMAGRRRMGGAVHNVGVMGERWLLMWSETTYGGDGFRECGR